MLGDQAIDQLGKEPSTGGTDGPDPDYYHTAPPFRGRFRLFPWGYGGGIGIGGILLIVLVVYLLVGHGRL
jgi:hypothetical protein